MMFTGFEVVFDVGKVKQKKRLPFVEFELSWRIKFKPKRITFDNSNLTKANLR